MGIGPPWNISFLGPTPGIIMSAVFSKIHGHYQQADRMNTECKLYQWAAYAISDRVTRPSNRHELEFGIIVEVDVDVK